MSHCPNWEGDSGSPQSNSAFTSIIWKLPGFEHLLSLSLPSFLPLHGSSGPSPSQLALPIPMPFTFSPIIFPFVSTVLCVLWMSAFPVSRSSPYTVMWFSHLPSLTTWLPHVCFEAIVWFLCLPVTSPITFLPLLLSAPPSAPSPGRRPTPSAGLEKTFQLPLYLSPWDWDGRTLLGGDESKSHKGTFEMGKRDYDPEAQDKIPPSLLCRKVGWLDGGVWNLPS